MFIYQSKPTVNDNTTSTKGLYINGNTKNNKKKVGR